MPQTRLYHSPAALQWALDKSGLKQKELAERIGKSQGHVSDLLSGRRSAPPSLLGQIAEALNCPVVALEAKRQQVSA